LNFEFVRAYSEESARELVRRLSTTDDDPYKTLLGPVFDGPNSPDTWRTILALLIVLTFGSLAAGAGVGGGGIFVPVFSALLELGGKASAPLSKITILGGSIGSMCFIGWKHHPDALKRPVIDYEVSTFMQAGELLGVTIGVVCNLLLPDLVILMFLFVVLIFNGWRTIKKGTSKYTQETAALASASKKNTRATPGPEKFPSEQCSEDSSIDIAQTEPGISLACFQPCSLDTAAQNDLDAFVESLNLGHCSESLNRCGVKSLFNLEAKDDLTLSKNGMDGAEILKLRRALHHLRLEAASTVAPGFDEGLVLEAPWTPTPMTPDVATEESVNQFDLQSAELAQLYKDTEAQWPLWAYATVVGMVAYTFVYAYLKEDPFNACFPINWVFWLWLFSPILVLGLCSLAIGAYLCRLHEKRLRLGFNYLATDIQWTTYRQFKFAGTSVVAGFAAGLLGIGGGMILGPLFVEMGMQPQVSAASCAYMIFWTGLSAVVQYYLIGAFGWQWLAVFGAAGLISGQIGQRGVYYAIKKYKRPSVLIFILGFIIILAVVLMTVSESILLAREWTTTEDMFALDTSWTECEE